MRFHRSSTLVSFVLAAAALLSRRASAQASPTATGPGQSIAIGVAASAYHIEYGQRWLAGPQAWIDYNPLLHLGVEGEIRRLDRNEDLGTHASTLLVGPRVPLFRGGTGPYIKVLAGSGQFHFPYRYAQGNYLVVAGGGGVDVRLGNHLQVRVLDVEYQRWPEFTFGSMSSFGISTGISYTGKIGQTWWVK